MSVTISGSGQIIKQVVQVVKTDTFTTTNGYPAFSDITGFTASITPTSASNKILIIATCNVGNGGDFVYLQLARNATGIFVGDAASTRPRVSAAMPYAAASNTYSLAPITLNYMDSPATTSATTYKVQMCSYNGSAAYLNRTNADRDSTTYDPRAPSSIILMEVAYA